MSSVLVSDSLGMLNLKTVSLERFVSLIRATAGGKEKRLEVNLEVCGWNLPFISPCPVFLFLVGYLFLFPFFSLFLSPSSLSFFLNFLNQSHYGLLHFPSLTIWLYPLNYRESEREVTESCPTLCHPMDCSPPGSSAHGILQARILEWAAVSFSRRFPRPRDRTRVSCTVVRRFTVWATVEVHPLHWLTMMLISGIHALV